MHFLFQLSPEQSFIHQSRRFLHLWHPGIKSVDLFLYTAYQTADFSKYPITIYAALIQFIISWIIPFAFVAFYPAAYLLGKKGFTETVCVEIILSIAFALIAGAVFKRGTRKYESAGN